MSRTDPAQHAAPATRTPVTLRVNGTDHALRPDHRVTLLDVLREELDLTGAKKGCDHGQCGACTVLLDGRRAYSCLLLAVAQDGAEVTTVEGLAATVPGGGPHPLQRAFLERDAFQCGFCTPGQLCSAAGALAEAAAGHPSAATPAEALAAPGPVTLTAEEIRERLSGNLCRCGAYPAIVQAVTDTAGGADAVDPAGAPATAGGADEAGAVA
ncbi:MULTISPECIES: (2Fe-2S)-binding protein [unclassified Streptomyces]|uniref:(2Fe-2S)-binding protein n=1 Tax=unclassified Streptomyces TaxID=2593676 RepID=UPI00288403E9|nr:2Fe-2S iron-sulfur cluster-binding protein [Streptomyces sp. DSM 41633]